MYVRRLELTNFRCYRQLSLTLPRGPILVLGGNGQGKTTLLEALFVLATTRAPYNFADRLLLNWAAAEDVIPFSRLVGEIVKATGSTTVDIVNARGGGDDRTTKRLRIDDVPRRAVDVIGTLNVVLFTPRDIDLMHGAPAERRRYLDVLLCQIDRRYVRALSQYGHALVQRNHLLRRLRERGGPRTELSVWDDALVGHGTTILARRAEAERALDRLARTVHASLVADDPPLTVRYRSQVVDSWRGAAPDAPDAPDAPEAPGSPAVASLTAQFEAALAARRDEEIARGVSLVGPHRDDLELQLGGIDVRLYGSRGQQRTVTLALKLAEADWMHAVTGERPVLLLDDVLSELDAERRRRLLETVAAHEQAWLTATDLEPADAAALAGAWVLEVDHATVRAPLTADPG